MNTVWFLKCVFLCYLVGFLSIRLFRNVWLAALVTVVLSGILPYGGVANFNFMLPMFWVGYACKLNQSLLDRHRKWFLGISLVAFGVMLPFWSGRLTVYMVPTQVLDWGDVHVGRAEPFCGALSSGDRHCRQHVVFPVVSLRLSPY